MQIPDYLAASIIVLAVLRQLVARFRKPRGRHAAPRSYQVSADYDKQTIKVFKTMNHPPPEFFEDGTPEWEDKFRTWQFDTSSIRALRARFKQDDDQTGERP